MITKEDVLRLNPKDPKDRKAIAQFLHNFAYAIPEDQWCAYHLADGEGRHCVMGWIVKQLDGYDPLTERYQIPRPCWWSWACEHFSHLIPVNNGEYGMAKYGSTPRQRVLNYLQEVMES